MKNKPPLLALGLFLVALLLYVGVWSPMSGALEKTRRSSSASSLRLEAMKIDIKRRAELQKRIAELKETAKANEETLISPMLNSYAMRVKSFLDDRIHEAGVLNVEYEEGEWRALPVPQSCLPGVRTARQSVRVRAQGDYAAIVSFLLRAEKELPLMTLQSISITQDPRTPVDVQTVGMALEWPREGEVVK